MQCGERGSLLADIWAGYSSMVDAVNGALQVIEGIDGSCNGAVTYCCKMVRAGYSSMVDAGNIALQMFVTNNWQPEKVHTPGGCATPSWWTPSTVRCRSMHSCTAQQPGCVLHLVVAISSAVHAGLRHIRNPLFARSYGLEACCSTCKSSQAGMH